MSEYFGPLISGDKINTELMRRKKPESEKTVTGSAANPNLIAEKVSLEKKEGWRVVRENVKSTRMAKQKPPDEKLEDEIWSILAQMGFKEMSLGRKFTIQESKGASRQIDVFAKDDETALVIECTQKDTPGKKQMAPLINKIKAFREGIRNSITGHYRGEARLKIKFVIATRNIEWGDADLKKCEEAGITVISDAEIDYYANLVELMRHAARFQLLAHMFEGGKVPNLSQEVIATQGKMGNQTFYIFQIRPDDLLKIAYVGHKGSRDIDNLETYQRMLAPKRLKEIAKFINEGGKFPTNIVLNIKTRKGSSMKFDIIKKVGDEVVGRLHLPGNYAAAWIIDGQHRLYGYAYARENSEFTEDKTTIPVLAYENLDAENEMRLFIDINSKQVKVKTNLLTELYANLHWGSKDPKEAFLALLSRVATDLNSNRESPMFKCMADSSKKKSSGGPLTITSISDGLKAAKLIGALSTGGITAGPFSTSDPRDYEANLKKASALISNCIGLFAEAMPEHWKLGSNVGGYLCTNIGIRALFHVFVDVAEHLKHNTGRDLQNLSVNQAFESMKPILMELVKYFDNASSDEIQKFRDIGSSLSLVEKQACLMELEIHKKLPGFSSFRLKKYIDTRDEQGSEETVNRIREIKNLLLKYVTSALQKEYGLVEDKWWTEGIPLAIRQKCTNEWERKNRKGSVESYLSLKHCAEIAEHNWSIMENAISLSAENKPIRAKLKWIYEVDKIDQRPGAQNTPLSRDEVESVKEIYDLVRNHPHMVVAKDNWEH